MNQRVGCIVLGLVVVGGCADHDPKLAAAEVSIEDVGPDAEQRHALHALTSEDDIADAVLAAAAAEVEGHGGHGASASAPESTTPALEAELADVRRAAESLMTKTHLSDAGYFLGVGYSSGVGTHYIDWRAVGAPFDPVHPAMLLVDDTHGHPRRLAGFSYWVRSAEPPAGFTGTADVWHHHLGLCFENAVLTREWLGDPRDCDGDWIDGRDLWMLHVWAVPGYENPTGIFAPTNPKLIAA